MTNPLYYKVTLAPPGDTDPPSAPAFTVDHMAGINPPFQNAPEFISVWSFMTAAEIADVRTRALTIDVAPKIQQAIDYVLGNAGSVPKNTLIFPIGSYRIEASLNVTGPLNMIGGGQGSGVFPFTQPPTELVWYGTADEPMMIAGANGDQVFTGGSLKQMCLNGRSIGNPLLLIDITRFSVKDYTLIKGKTYCLRIINSPGIAYPTSFCTLENGLIEVDVTGTDTCVGIDIDGDISEDPSVAGVAGFTFDQTVIQTDKGSPIRVGNRGDNFVWKRTIANSTDYVTGPIWFTATDPEVAICDGHVFIGIAANCGFRFDGAGCNYSTRIIDLDQSDLLDNAQRDPNVYISGPGAPEVTIDGNLGNTWGKLVTGPWKNTQLQDGMQFVRWDSANSVLHTANGAWFTDVDSSGTITDGAQPGGAVLLTTDNSANDHAAILENAAPSASGVTVDNAPQAVFTVGPVDTADVIYRIGYFDTVTDPPTNGIYAEYDLSQSSKWRFVCRAAGSQTVALSSYDANTGIYQIKIAVAPIPTSVNFAARVTPNAVFETPLVITTNIPSGSLSFGAIAITTTTAAKTLLVLDAKRGYQTEE